MLEIAREFLSAGFSVIPVKGDGSKAPALSSFEEYKTKRRPTEEEVKKWFSDRDRAIGVAVICGVLSGNLAVMDFEKKETFQSWSELCDSEGLDIGDLPVVSTPRGMHVYVRLPESEPGRKLASELVEVEGKDGSRHLNAKVLIEVRGQGQYVVGPGSPPECHPSRKAGWSQAYGPEIIETPVVDLSFWRGLVRCACSFNQAPTSKERLVSGLGKIKHDDQRPGTDFCRRGTREEFGVILERAGWTRIRTDPSGREIWRRPGKDEPGGSATLGAVTTSLGECLYVFSTNADPFEADTCYSIFAARALLQYSGDFARAAGQCRVEGYGAPPPEELKQEISGYIERWNDDAKIEILRNRIADMCGASLTFKKTWEKKRTKDLGEDPHRYTRSLLYQAARALGTPEESGLCQGVGMVRLWRERFSEDPQRAFDVDYMARQAADVLSLLHKNEDEVHAEAEAKEAGETEQSRLAWLSDKFAFAVGGWIQYRSVADEATYWLGLNGGTSQVKIGDIKSWETWTAFNRALRGWADPATGQGIEGFDGMLPQALEPKAAWSAVIKVLYSVRRVIGSEDTTSCALYEWAYEYGDYHGAWDDGDETDGDSWKHRALSGQPFVFDGVFHLSLDTLLRWINAQKSESFTRRALIDEMRAAGFVKASKQIFDPEGCRRRKKFWVYDAEKLRALANDDEEAPF